VESYSIRPLLLSTAEASTSMMTYMLYPDRVSVLPMVAWYINANGTHILVDTGISAEEHLKFAKVKMEEIQSFETALSKVGISPEDIDILILTHLHYDHCANARKCTNAKVVVQKKELLFAYANHPVFGHYYMKEYFNDLNFWLVDGRREIHPGIEVIPMTGHTPGCQAVAVETEEGLAVISGACTIKENFYPPGKLTKVWPVLIPTFHIDIMQSFNDLIYLKGLADILIPQHDLECASKSQIPEPKS